MAFSTLLDRKVSNTESELGILRKIRLWVICNRWERAPKFTKLRVGKVIHLRKVQLSNYIWCCYINQNKLTLSWCKTSDCLALPIPCVFQWSLTSFWKAIILVPAVKQSFIMTSSNGNIFRVTGPLYWDFTGYQWIPLTKASGHIHRTAESLYCVLYESLLLYIWNMKFIFRIWHHLTHII